MQLQLFSYGKFVSDAQNAYMTIPVNDNYRFKSTPYTNSQKEFYQIYKSATKGRSYPFVTEDIVRYAIRKFYEHSRVKSHPLQVAKIATKFADEYNLAVAKAMKLNVDLSQLKMPDFTTLTEIIEWFGGMLESIIKGVSGVWQASSGIIFIAGLILSPVIIGIPIAIAGFIALILSKIGPNLTITVSKSLWSAVKGIMRNLGILEQDRIIHNLVKDTFAYESLIEAINIIRQYKEGDKIPPKVTKKLKVLLEEAEVELEDFHSGLKHLKTLAKKAQDRMDKEKK